jgi:hypothetical protein
MTPAPPETPEHAALTRAAQHALAWLDGLDARSVATTATPEEMRARLGRPLADRGVAATQVIDDLAADVEGGILGSQSGRFFAWVIGGGSPAAMAADWLTTVWDQNAGIHACGPAASVVEEVAAGWLRDLFEMPDGTSVGFTTGTQMAHMTCLAAARHAVLRDRGWDVETKGLAGAPPIRILANAERHGSVDRAVRFLGLGSESIVPLPVDDDGRVTPEALAAALAASTGPAVVVLQAGELNRAAFDPFETLAPMALGQDQSAPPPPRPRPRALRFLDHRRAQVPERPLRLGSRLRARRERPSGGHDALHQLPAGRRGGPRPDRLEPGVLPPRAGLRHLRRPARAGP